MKDSRRCSNSASAWWSTCAGVRAKTKSDGHEAGDAIRFDSVALSISRDEPFAKFLRVLRENSGKKAFVHCRLGDDRTGMAVAAYRMAEEGWTAEEAMKEMKAFGFTTMHHAMCPGLAGYEESFPQRFKTSRAFKELQSKGSNTATK